MKTPSWWQSANIVSILLLPVSWIWGLVTELRLKLVNPEKVDAYVICVGNVVAGGGGKTPVALSIGEHLKEQHIPAFFISRGYGAQIREPIFVNPAIHMAKQVGDEALLLAQTLPTIVCPDRVKAAKLAVSKGAKILVLDDGFQNPYLYKNLSILVLKGNAPLGNRKLMPAGPLREKFVAAIARAQALVLINAEANSFPTKLPTFHVKTILQLDAEKKQKIIAFAGIAKPETFKSDLRQAGYEIAEFLSYADHHYYTASDLKTLENLATKYQARLVTTQKDAVRLPASFIEKHQPAIASQQIQWEPEHAIKELLSKVPSL